MFSICDSIYNMNIGEKEEESKEEESKEEEMNNKYLIYGDPINGHYSKSTGFLYRCEFSQTYEYPEKFKVKNLNYAQFKMVRPENTIDVFRIGIKNEILYKTLGYNQHFYFVPIKIIKPRVLAKLNKVL